MFRMSFWEPFLEDFWREDLSALLQQEAHRQGKALQQVERHPVFDEMDAQTVK